MDSFRKSEFKKGISGKTKKRHDNQISLRKEKKEAKLSKRRDYQKPQQNSEFKTYLDNFNPQALEQGDLKTLKHLKHMISIANEQEIERHIMRHILPYIPILVKYCQTTEPHRLEYVECALSCLVNLTSTQQDQNDKLAIAIFKSKFVSETIPTMLLSFHQGNNGCMSLKVRRAIWDVLSNLALTSKQAVMDIFKSPILNMGDSKSLFFQELFSLYDKNFTSDDTRLSLMPYMVYLVRALYGYETYKVPTAFCIGIWPFLQKVVQDIQPVSRDEMSPDVICLCANLYKAIFTLIMTQNEHDTIQMARMIISTDTGSMLTRMLEMMRVTVVGVQLFIVKIVGYIMFIEIGEGYMQKLMTHTGWDRKMIQLADHNDFEIRQRALLFLGNFVSDGTPYVLQLIEYGVISCVINKLNRERYNIVKYRALYVFLKMFTACDADRRQCPNERIKNLAEGIMRTLVVEKSMFNYVLPFITQAGNDVLIIKDALRILETALLWNKELIISQINDTGERALQELMNQINHNKGDKDTTLFELACRVDDLVTDNNMDLETSNYFEGDTNLFQEGQGFSF